MASYLRAQFEGFGPCTIAESNHEEERSEGSVLRGIFTRQADSGLSHKNAKLRSIDVTGASNAVRLPRTGHYYGQTLCHCLFW